MVEPSVDLDRVLGALADATRRDILKGVSREEHPISELAEPYNMSLVAIARTIIVLEKAGLITKLSVAAARKADGGNPLKLSASF